jgi:hypothetical protein
MYEDQNRTKISPDAVPQMYEIYLDTWCGSTNKV